MSFLNAFKGRRESNQGNPVGAGKVAVGLGLILLAVALFLVLGRGDSPPLERSASRSRDGQTSISSRAQDGDIPDRLIRRKLPTVPLPRKPDPGVIERYESWAKSPDRGAGDLEQAMARGGVDDLPELMIGAFKGDPDELERVFSLPSTDGAASEGFHHGLETLIEQLGDRYFSYHLSRQSEEIQMRIVRALEIHLRFEDTKYPQARRIMLSVLPEEEIVRRLNGN